MRDGFKGGMEIDEAVQVAKRRNLQRSKDMELKDLKTGMVVETRNGTKYLVVNRDGELCDIGMNCYMTLDGRDPHKSNMTWPNDSSLDIMKVFKPKLRKFSIMLSDEHNCIWKREEVRRMTVSEVCKELGYEVEIVRDDS